METSPYHRCLCREFVVAFAFCSYDISRPILVTLAHISLRRCRLLGVDATKGGAHLLFFHCGHARRRLDLQRAVHDSRRANIVASIPLRYKRHAFSRIELAVAAIPWSYFLLIIPYTQRRDGCRVPDRKNGHPTGTDHGVGLVDGIHRGLGSGCGDILVGCREA